MAYDPIVLGSVANDGTGDTLRDAGTKINANFGSIDTQLALKAPLASPTFSGTPAAPTAAGGTNTTQIATTAFVTGALGGYQPLDSDLTAIAALTTTSFGRSALTVADAAALRTLAGTVIGTDVQAYDADLGAIAALSPANDDIVQRKAGAWTNRTPAQLRADLASPRIIAASGASASLTGTLTETVLATITIPANAMGANGQIVVEAYLSCTSGGAPGNRDVRVRFGGNAIGTSTEFFIFRGSNTTLTMQVHARISNGNATNAQKGPALQTTVSGYGASSNAKVTASYDTTSDQYILITGDLTDTGDTIVLESYNVMLIRPD
jgi:hypothetical protein